jgi:mRNA interferase MazF
MITEVDCPRRGEIWMVNFDPTIGAEIKKTRPALLLSINSLGVLPLKIVVPVTGWRREFSGNAWHVFLEPTRQNGLQKESALDLLQIKSIDERRLVKKLGAVDQATISEAMKALLIVVGYQ